MPPGVSFHSLSPLQSAEADSRSVPRYTSWLCPFHAPSIPVCLIPPGTEFAGHSNARMKINLVLVAWRRLAQRQNGGGEEQEQCEQYRFGGHRNQSIPISRHGAQRRNYKSPRRDGGGAFRAQTACGGTNAAPAAGAFNTADAAFGATGYLKRAQAPPVNSTRLLLTVGLFSLPNDGLAMAFNQHLPSDCGNLN